MRKKYICMYMCGIKYIKEAKAIHYHHYQKRVKIVAKKLHNLCDIDCRDWPPIKCHLPPNKCRNASVAQRRADINKYIFIFIKMHEF